MNEEVQKIFTKLEEYISKEKWKGWDPFDALNSKLLKSLTLNNKLLGIFFTHLLKKLPLNLRGVLGIKRDYNPKAIGLFASGYLLNYQRTSDKRYLERAKFFIDWLIDNFSKGYSGYCWGYNFDWPNRAFYAKKGIPTIVNTSFIANAFIDAYKMLDNEKYLRIARSSCDFIIKDLNRFIENDTFCFSYTPIDNSRIHNANILGSALLARVYSLTKEDILLDYCDKSVRFTVKHQNDNGSWYYGEAKNQKWIDLFHTGYVLESLENYIRFTGNRDYEENLKTGFDFFLENFFENGVPKYYHNQVYPIDVHCSAQAIITLLKLKRLDGNSTELAKKVAAWTIKNMHDERDYFYYQKYRHYINKIPYMRWIQAWMFKALIMLLKEEGID
ncbi:MAG: glycoside hydrolase family 88 protein [Candidatus Marinimicrobia bacterium]|nr:glycoside hydrolase family 88 protein [candidate division WOR-3 bacterium]MCK4445833.1 glycoside hydrolase family 88 protein [Candidatus Neomarinimicrobiota bacterium]